MTDTSTVVTEAPPQNISVVDDLPTVLRLLAGSSTKGAKSGLALEAESTAMMRQHAGREKAMTNLVKVQTKALTKLKNGELPGQAEFAKALQTYADRDAKNRDRRKLVDAARAAADRAKTSAEKKRYTDLALGRLNEMGRSDDKARLALKRAADKFATSLRNAGAADQALQVINLSTKTHPADLGSGKAALANLTKSLEQDIDRNTKSQIEAKNLLEAERRHSEKRRKKIAKAAEVLKRFNSKQAIADGEKMHKQRTKAREDHRKLRDAYFAKYGRKYAFSNTGTFKTSPEGHQARKAWRAVESAKSKADKLNEHDHPRAQIAEALDTVIANLPQGHPRRLALEGLTASVKLRAIEADYQVMKQRLRDAAKSLKPGSSSEATGTLEVGASFGLPVLAKVEATLIAGVTQKIERVRNAADGSLSWKASFVHNESLSVNAKFGDLSGTGNDDKQALKANVTAAMEIGTVRTYDSLEALLTNESERSMKLVFLGSDANKKQAEKSMAKFLHEREQLIVDASQKSKDLDRLLAQASRRPIKLSNPVPDFGQTAQITTHSKSGALSTGAAMGFSSEQGSSALFAANAKFQHKRRSEQSFLTISYLDEIMADPVRQRLHQLAHAKRFAFYHSNGDVLTDVEYGPDAVAHLDQMEAELALANRTLSDPSATEIQKHQAKLIQEAERAKAWNNLEGMVYEYQRWLTLENGLSTERLSSSKETIAARDHAMTARKLKAGDRAALIRAMSLQYAVAKRIYLSSYSGQEKPPPEKLDQMAALEADLATPKIGLKARQIQEEFGTEAVGKKAKINSTTLTFGFSGGFKKGGGGVIDFSDGADNIADGDGKSDGNKKKLKNTALAGISVNAEVNFDEKWGEGKGEPEKKMSVEFRVSHAGGDIASKEVVTAIVGKLFSSNDLLKNKAEIDGLKQECLASVLKLGLSTLTSGPVRLELVRPPGKPTRWTLKETLAYTMTERQTGARSTIPLGGPVGVVVGFNLAKKHKRLVKTQRAHKTLAGIGETFRSNNASGSTNDESWIKFKEQTGLLDRLVTQLDSEVADGAGVKHGTKKGSPNLASFDTFLVQIQAGEKINKEKMILTTKKGGRATLSTDLLELLIDLKGGEAAEQEAADKLIKAWQDRAAAKNAKNADAHTKKLMAAFDEAIAQKSAKETRTATDDYQKPTGFTGDEINKLLVDQLAKKFRVLSDATGVEASSLPELRKKLITNYRLGMQTEAQIKKNLKAARTVMALEYAAYTMDDLSRYENETDKEVALGHLGTNLDKLTDEEPRVYVSSMVDGELVEKDGKLQLRLIIKDGFEKALTEAQLKLAHENALKRINADVALVTDPAFDLDEVAYEKGDGRRKWHATLHSVRAENDAFMKLADKKFPSKSLTVRGKRLSRAKRTHGQANRASLLAALATVLEQQERAKLNKRLSNTKSSVGSH